MYDKLANLVVIKGVNVQKDQPVVIRANVRDAAFVRKIVKCAYEAVRERGSAVGSAPVEVRQGQASA